MNANKESKSKTKQCDWNCDSNQSDCNRDQSDNQKQYNHSTRGTESIHSEWSNFEDSWNSGYKFGKITGLTKSPLTLIDHLQDVAAVAVHFI